MSKLSIMAACSLFAVGLSGSAIAGQASESLNEASADTVSGSSSLVQGAVDAWLKQVGNAPGDTTMEKSVVVFDADGKRAYRLAGGTISSAGATNGRRVLLLSIGTGAGCAEHTMISFSARNGSTLVTDLTTFAGTTVDNAQFQATVCENTETYDNLGAETVRSTTATGAVCDGTSATKADFLSQYIPSGSGIVVTNAITNCPANGDIVASAAAAGS